MEHPHHHRIVGSASFTTQADEVMEAIRRRAHEMWEAEGRPPGRDLDYWLKAEAEVMDHIAARQI